MICSPMQHTKLQTDNCKDYPLSEDFKEREHFILTWKGRKGILEKVKAWRGPTF